MRVAVLIALLAACGGAGRFAPDTSIVEPCGSCGGTASMAMQLAMISVVVGSTVYGILAER